MFDNPVAPERHTEPKVETEVLTGEIANPPAIEIVDGVEEARFNLQVKHPSHEIAARIPIVCRGEALRRVEHLRRGSKVTIAGIRAYDEDRDPEEFVLCEYLKISSIAPPSGTR